MTARQSALPLFLTFSFLSFCFASAQQLEQNVKTLISTRKEAGLQPVRSDAAAAYCEVTLRLLNSSAPREHCSRLAYVAGAVYALTQPPFLRRFECVSWPDAQLPMETRLKVSIR